MLWSIIFANELKQHQELMKTLCWSWIVVAARTSIRLGGGGLGGASRGGSGGGWGRDDLLVAIQSNARKIYSVAFLYNVLNRQKLFQKCKKVDYCNKNYEFLSQNCLKKPF